MSENSEYEKKRAENSTQLRLVQFLAGYANNPDHAYEVLPVNVGLTDTGLAELINRYNEMLLERKRLLRSSQENNPHHQCSGTGTPAGQHLAPAGNQSRPLPDAAAKA